MAGPTNFNQQLIEEYRATEGHVSGAFAGRPLLLLTTTGAKSGQPRTAPVMYTTDGDDLVVVASKGGAPENPDWYYNLRAHPRVTVELGVDRFEARARITSGEERARLYAAHAALIPSFAEYERKASREIPVVVLERIS